MTLTSQLAAPMLALLCGAATAQSIAFDALPMSSGGCTSVTPTQLVLTTCYTPGDTCGDSQVSFTATVPGTFTADLIWDVTGVKEYSTLEIWLSEQGQVFSHQGPFLQDAWCLPIPCGGTVDDISFHVGVGETVTFLLTNHFEPCTGAADDGIRCIFENLEFTPDPGIYDLELGLDASPIAELEPTTPSLDTFTDSLELLRDVDGDGLGEVIIGRPWTTQPFDDRGLVSVHSGSTGALLWEFSGAIGAELGRSVADAGDVNGDGVFDVVAGAPEWGGADRGRVRVWSGDDGTLLEVWDGVFPSSAWGESVDGVGDMDGDGFDDVGIGAPNESSSTGAVWVRSGQTGGTIWHFTGDQSLDSMGETVAGVGDVNADGFLDVAGGAPSSDIAGNGSGLVRVWSGLTGAVLYDFSGAPGDHWGTVIDGAGDVDGDGFDDVLVAARSAKGRTGASSAGRARVMSGADGHVLFDKTGLSTLQLFGSDATALGDIDDDGFADVAVGDHKTARGRVRIFGGPNGEPILDATSPRHTDFGLRVAGGLDMDGDGREDLAVLATSITDHHAVLTVRTDPDLYRVPTLAATGPLTPLSTLDFTIADGPPGAPAALILGLRAEALAFANGLLVPTTDAIVSPLGLDGAGALALSTTWPANLSAPTSVVAQVWIAEPAALSGLVATNAVALDPP